ncbi:CHASE domain-containing protein [Pseudomonas sp. App30]|uniref:PAS domain-containing hybrid sensor histidine kinase/response regulator n=1 Tax=Pseudomonas sp. App30 TaxID=3068990 RepID=UPI003A8018C5
MAAEITAARLRSNPGWAIAALALGLVLTGLAVWQRLDTNQQELDEAVAQQANQIADRVVERLTLYQYGLRSLRGLWHTVGVDSLSPAQFATYNATRNVVLEFPGALSFGIVRKISAAQVANFTQQAVQEGETAFTVHGFAPHDGDVYVIRYVQPPGPRNIAQGLDIASEPNRRKAADAALLTGEPQLTGPVTLVQSEGEVRRGFLMVMPVYQTPTPPDGYAQRTAQGIGWTYVSLLIKDVLKDLNWHSAGTQLEIADITDTSAAPPFYVQARSPEDAKAVASSSIERQLFGRTWHITLTVFPPFVRQLHPTPPGLILALGLLSSLLLALVVQLLRQRLLRDITEQKAHHAKTQQLAQVLESEVNQRTQALQSLDLLLKNILDAATGVSIIATDPNRIIRVFNRGAERMLGYSAEEVIGRFTPELMHDPDELRAQNQQMAARYGGEFSGIDGYVAQTRNQAEPSVFQCHYRRKDGSYLLVHLVVTVMRDHAQAITGYLGFAIDVSAQRELEINLQKAKVEADKANMAKSAFLASMSHEIRTPMNAVLGMLQLAAQSGLNADQQDFVSRAQTAATLLLGLLNDILDYSKIEAGKLQVDEHPFNLEELLRDLGVVLSGNQPHNDVELMFDIDPQLPLGLIGDSLRLQQVLINLAGNALKFTSAGQVVISVRQVRCSASRVGIEFAVADSGIGMDAEQLARIFQAFSQGDASTARKFGGSGLGLLICKRLTDLMGSDLRVDSEPGLGSRFWFELGLAIDPAQQSASPLPPLQVLLVDDNPLAGALLKRNLEGLGWAAERITRLDQGFTQAFDVLVVDWRLLEAQPPPALGPLKAIEQLVVLVTAFSRDAATQALHGAGLRPPLLLTKPLTPRQLARHLADLRPAPSQPPAKPAAAPARPKRLAGLRLLLVEDNAVNQMVAAGLLKAEGASVDLADCGMAGVERALHAQPPYDLVLMDLRMPDIDGQEATRRIRQAIPADQLPIVAMTANVSEQDREQCLAAGMNEHVGKPINLERLVEVIRRFR